MSTTSGTLASRAIETLANGTHADPFAVLGPHLVRQNGASGLAIRAFRPHAAEITIVERPAGRSIPMAQLHPEGVFEAWIDGATRDGFDYRYRVRWPNGNESEL